MRAIFQQGDSVMNKPFSLFAVPMAIVFLAVPSLAQVVTETGMDVSDMTCGDVKAMDHDQMMAVSIEAMKMASMSDDEKAEMDAMTQEERVKSQSAEAAETAAMTNDQKVENSKKMDESMAKLMTACGSDDSMMIMDAAKAVAKD